MHSADREDKSNQIKSIFIIHQYTKHKNENFPLTHGLKTEEGTFKIAATTTTITTTKKT